MKNKEQKIVVPHWVGSVRNARDQKDMWHHEGQYLARNSKKRPVTSERKPMLQIARFTPEKTTR